MDGPNHHPLLPLSELKKVQRAELARHEINKPTEKKKQKSKEGGIPSMPGHSLLQLLEPSALPRAHKGATLTPKKCQSPGSTWGGLEQAGLAAQKVLLKRNKREKW